MADQNEYMYYQQDPDPQNRYSYQDPIPTSGGPVGPEHSPKKPGGWRKILALVLVCALVGGGAGAGGAALYNNFSNSGGTTVVQEMERPQVQTVVNSKNGQAMTGAELYAANLGSCVGITVSTTSVNIFGQTTTSAASGSGFVLTQDGYIVTNYHVIEDAAKDSSVSVEVSFANGDKYTAKLVGGEQDNDVAVLKIDATGLTPVTLGDSDKLVVGEQVYAIGNPLGELTYSLTDGIISALDRLITTSSTNANNQTESVTLNVLQTNCAINPGNSGGPLMNLYGEVVGIVSAKYSSYSDTTVEGIGFAIPISDVQTIITDIMENGQVTDKAYMAIKAGSMTEQMAAQYNIDVTKGVFVYAVEKGGAGEKAGLQLGDVITKLNDTDITSMSDLSMAKKSYKAGDTVTLTVWRGGQEITLSLTFDQQPQTTGTEDDSPNQNQGQQDSYGDLYDYFFGRGNGGRGN